MDFVNRAGLPAAWTLGFEPDGRELVVIVVKATFTIPAPGEEPRLSDEQFRLIEADEFTGEPGASAPLYDTDFAHRKPHCDVLLNGSAHAPGGRSARQVTVGARVGRVAKAFVVKGQRHWQQRLVAVVPGTPEPFMRLPISYDVAYGGIDASAGDPNRVKTFLSNPAGRGYARDGAALPNTEEIGVPVEDRGGPYRPMSFGPIGRAWKPRSEWAGTYDQRWLDERAPFWPADFDPRYFQAAPPDQQGPYLHGGEEVALHNLTPGGRIDFRLPRLHLPILLVPHQGADQQIDPVIDTIVLEPDLGRFMLTWRASVPMRRSCFDLRELIVGQARAAPYRIRRPSQRPRRSLDELVRLRRRALRAESAP